MYFNNSSDVLDTAATSFSLARALATARRDTTAAAALETIYEASRAPGRSAAHQIASGLAEAVNTTATGSPFDGVTVSAALTIMASGNQ